MSLPSNPSHENKKRRIPIWLTTLIVIVMILLFSLLINNAREKEVVEQFSRQQMAIARGAAAGIEDLISSMEKSMIIHSRRRSSEKTDSDLTLENMRIIYEDLEGKIEFIAKENESGSALLAYPSSFRKDFVAKRPELQNLIRKIRATGSPHVSDLLWIDREEPGTAKKRSNFIIVAVPRFDAENRFSGVVFAALSLSAIVDRYIQPAKDDFSCDAWIIDDRGIILFHPNRALTGVDAAKIEGKGPAEGISLKEMMLKGGDGLGDYYFLDEKDGIEKNIVAYAPINLGSRKWSIAVSLPYQAAVSHLKKTFFILMLEAFILIITVIVGSALILYSGKKRFMLEEELKRFKERDDWQEKLAREKKTIEGIIGGSPIPTFVIDRDHRIIFWNRACEELTGYKGADMIGTDRQYIPFYAEKRPVIADVIVDDDIEGLEKYYGKKRVQKSAVVEGAYEASDFYENLGGRRRHLYFLAAPIYDESGKVIAAIETLQDVTREREMERDLKEYAETLKNELYENIKLREDIEELYNYLQSILESSPDRIFDVTNDGIINYVSRSLHIGDGLTAQQIEGKHFTEFVTSEHRKSTIKVWDEIKRGIYKPFEMEVRARDGSKRSLLITPRPIKGTDRYILVQRDITEFKDLEKKFYESQKLAAVGQLSAGIAHEVRNPLSSIKMSLQILEKRLHPEGNDLKRFKIAEKEVEHLEKLVSDILIFARPLEPEMKKADISTFLENSLNMAEKEIAEKKIEVLKNFDHGLSAVNFDSAMLKQALLNVYLNAIDAMDEGGRLSISTKPLRKDNQSFVVIEIEDNGCGIDPEDTPHLFNPFFTKKKYGTGLGLTQVKKIIDLHQGTIEIVSAKGKGTKVLVALPA